VDKWFTTFLDHLVFKVCGALTPLCPTNTVISS
jgi:hypothetical protein